MTDDVVEYCVTYDLATGNYAGAWAMGPTGYAALIAAHAPAGFGVIQVPKAAILQPTEVGATSSIDLTLLKATAAANVGNAAEAVRQRFITPGSGKAMSYQQKIAEANAWTADHTAVTPILTAEAAARGTTEAALVGEVLAVFGYWLSAEAKINAAEMGAKTAIAAATNIGAIVAAAVIDWDAALSA